LSSVTVGGPVSETYTPSLAELMAYDAIFVWGSASLSGDLFGDVLADYVDAGGGVVIAVFAQPPGAIVGSRGASRPMATCPTCRPTTCSSR